MDITKIPAIMRAQSPAWGNAAALMDRWFAGAPAVKPAYGPPDTTTIRLDPWLLTFKRAKDVFDTKIIAEEYWRTPKAEAKLGAILAREGLLKGAGSFSFLGGALPTLDPQHYQDLPVGGDLLRDPLDDLFGALARYNLRILAAGRITPAEGSEYLVSVLQIGVYLRDTYDFNDPAKKLDEPKTWISQPLGYWNETTKQVSKWPGSGFDLVSNSDFRAWRKAHGKGGDFEIFSDLKTIPIPGGWSFRALGDAVPVTPPVKPLRVRTRAGDSLSGLAIKHYGDWQLWPIIWDANRAAVGPRPSRLKIGVDLDLPPLPGMSAARIEGARKRAPKWKNNEFSDP
jgi:hypothetical protein